MANRTAIHKFNILDTRDSKARVSARLHRGDEQQLCFALFLQSSVGTCLVDSGR